MRIGKNCLAAYINGKPGKAQLQVRYEYAKTQPDQKTPAFLNPILIARPSVIPGREAITRMTYNPAGQPIEVTETGFAPALADQAPSGFKPVGSALTNAPHQAKPTKLKRTTRYRYRTLNGRSVLTEIDGPLPNGPSNSPSDSDVTRIEWDQHGGLPLRLIYPGLLKTQVEARDAAGRPTVVREINGVLTRIDYAYTGQANRITRAGRQVEIGYDAQMLPTLLRANDGQTIRIAYSQGTRRVTLPDGQILEERFNSEMQLRTIGWFHADGKALSQPGRYEYDARSAQLSAIVSPTGRRTSLDYDARGRLAAWQRGKTRTTQRFDPQARLLEADIGGAKYRLQAETEAAGLSLTLPTAAVHRELIDDFGRVVQQSSPERGVRTATYDAADRTLEVRDSLRVMRATYDPAGRILERRHQNLADQQSRIVRTTWQGANLVRIDDPEQQSEYRYDNNGRTIEERITLKVGMGNKAQTHLTQYRYDTLGRLSQTILPEGATLSHRYNAIGRLIQTDYQPPAFRWWQKAIRWVKADYGTRPLIAHIETDSAHGLKGYTHANGEKVSTRFDPALRLTQRQDGHSSTRLTYNANDEIGQLKRNRQTLALGYDVWGRLTQVKQGGAGEQFALDANGNRLAASAANRPASALIAKIAAGDSTQSYAYHPASDQLLDTAAERYHYNAVGEPVQIAANALSGQAASRQLNDGATRTLAYGPMGELVLVSDNGKPTARYRYNQNRQRIAKTVNNHTTFFLWQGGAIAAEANQSGHIEKRYVYLGSRPVALIQYDRDKNPKLYAIHTDHLGTPLQVTDANKTIVWQAEYEVYGRASVSNHSLHVGASPPSLASFGINEAHAITITNIEFNLRLPGQYEDRETGYHYNFHRYYNPDTGRYLTPDPIGLEGGTNLYGYADGDPVGKSDPWGLYTVYWGGAGLNGGYIDDQIQALKQAGLINVQKGTGSGGTILDIVNVNIFRYEINSDFFKLPSGIQKTQCPEQFNLIGYSYGSLIAAQTAYYYANRGTIVDNLVLIGAPIDADFLTKLQSSANIKKVTIKNLTSRGDPIYAGMTQMELVSSLPTLASQQSANTGHFYYAPNNLVGKIRRETLADELFASGLR